MAQELNKTGILPHKPVEAQVIIIPSLPRYFQTKSQQG